MEREVSMLTLYRKHMLPLRFQNSDDGHAFPSVFGIEKQFGKKTLATHYDSEGSLWLDLEEVRIIDGILASSLKKDGEFIGKLMTSHRMVVKDLREISSYAFSMNGKPEGSAELFDILSKWHERVLTFYPFLVLTKFFPETVYNLIKAHEKNFVNRYPELWNKFTLPQSVRSLEYVDVMLGLYVYLRERKPNFSFENKMDGDTFEAIEAFKINWGGFGPREWDLPGSESTNYIITKLREMFDDLSLAEAKRMLKERKEATRLKAQTKLLATKELKKTSPDFARTMNLMKFLWDLQEMTEQETEIYRGSFYFGILPVLRQTSTFLKTRGKIAENQDILFLTVPEILRYESLNRDETERRKQTYWRIINEARKGVSRNRLEVIINGNYNG
jgi:hypothetical protein